ncbi:MAG: hypothetical protein R3D58_10670 [Saprospiraceae bacterium]|nr:hypothetical protein [Lewinellaceae bacterium]
MKNRIATWLPIAALSLIFCKPALAQPDTVRIGAFVNDVYDINLAEKSFSAQFWVWFNYRDSTLHPLETLEIPNAKEVDYSLEFSEEKNGICWAGKKVTAQIKKDWDIRRFPFDAQRLTIELEESDKDIESMVYVADSLNTRLDEHLIISNWQIERFEITSGGKKYATTYGDPGLADSSAYPHASITLFITRKSWGLFFSLFTGMYVAFFISTLVFFIDPIDVDPRFGLSVGGLFAAVGNKYIVDSILPQSTTFTLVDKLHILTYVSMLLCIIFSVISLRIWKNGNPKKSARFDRRMYFTITSVYILINVLLIYSASVGG